MTLFYCPTIHSSSVLSEEESQHAVKVLRLQAGDDIVVIDGVGGYYKARITQPNPKRCAFEVIEQQSEFGKRNYNLHVAIAPTKNIERLEWFVEKVTEIGIDQITPVICRYSERKTVKEERLEKIIVSACKQSVKAFFPKLNRVNTFTELLIGAKAEQKFIAHCYDEDKKLLKNEINPHGDALILIGPEGDFSREEVEMALLAGFVPVSLGGSRLRTETAGVVACHTVALMNQ
jgi:16S rRNA (uracil1498-N3)-methyltransferase